MVYPPVVNGNPRDFYARDGWTTADTRFEKYMGDFPIDEARPLHAQLAKPVSIETALNEYCHIPAAYYAIAIIQHDGEIKTYASDPVRHAEQRLFSQRFLHDFQRATQRPTRNSSYSQGYLHENMANYGDPDTDSGDGARRQSSSTDSSSGRHNSFHRRMKMEGGDSENEEPSSAKSASRKRARFSRYPPTVPEDDAPLPVPVRNTRQLTIGDSGEVNQFYTQRFKDLQQGACKYIAKAFVKIMEPKKQTNFPYTGGNDKAPAWWPPRPDEKDTTGKKGCRHREPDHLYKGERVRLLVHILQVVVDQSPQKPPSLQDITVKRLEEVTTEAMSNWFNDKDHPDNALKKPFLREIFKVAKQQERYNKGEIDASCSITISHGDRPGQNVSDDEADDGFKYEDEEMVNENMTPTPHPISTSPENLLSPNSSQVQNGTHDSEDFAYGNIRDLPLRSYHSQLPGTTEDQQAFSDGGQMPLAGQQNYMSRPTSNFQHQNMGVHDASRRPSWQSNGYSTPSPSGVFGNWPNNNTVVPNAPLQYNNYTTAAPSSILQPAPYLPPPTTNHGLLPSIHHQQQSFTELPTSRPFDTGAPPIGNPLRTGSLGHPHQLAQHHSFQEYLHDGSYSHHDIKDNHILNTQSC